MIVSVGVVTVVAAACEIGLPHCGQILALRVNPHAEFLTFRSESIFQLSRAFTRARRIDNDHHREFSLHDGLVDVDDTATSRRQYLRNAGDNPRMVQSEN